jgi:hypothetical protein
MNKSMWITKHGELLENKLKEANNEIDELKTRIASIESMLLMSGIIERLDMTDIISIEDNDPWSFHSKTHYKVKKVTS